jgi:two-component system chemotaxis sensor kinase CheA
MARDPYRYFRLEGASLLDQMLKSALDLDKGVADGTKVGQLLRLAHTLKGAARVVKQIEISELSHAVEGALAPYREGDRPIAHASIDSILSMLDRIGNHLKTLPMAQVDPAPVTAGESARVGRSDPADIEALLESLGEVQADLAAMREISAHTQQARQLIARLVAQLGPTWAGEAPGTMGRGTRLNKARGVAETVLNKMMLIQKSAAESVGRAERELRQAREQAERIRLTPASAMFNALERLTRDCAQSAGRRVSFAASGADVRLDANVIEAVQDALLQVIRNAVAHGIEPGAERERVGKSAEGHISLEVSRQGHRVSFRCQDDGRGVDLEAVRRALKKKGRLAEDSGQLSPAALLQQLLQGGTSTASSVTELSGRGIGLDVVREVAARLDGEVSMQTEPGLGTTVTLRVPISLASLEALIVEAGGHSFAIPLHTVRASVRVAPGDVIRSPEGDSIVFGERMSRIVPLASLVSAQRATSPTTAFSALIMQDETRSIALAVDRLAGRQTITVRSLPKLAVTNGIVQGAYLDADGNPQSVLEPEWLIRCVRGSGATSGEDIRVPSRRVLVIDDSITTRMLEHSILESAGYEVDMATSGEEGLVKAQQGQYSLILVDVEMPGMDGFTFIERSQADPSLHGVPCILVTSRDAAQDRRRAELVGARAYIVKSEFNQVEFLDRVATLVQG